MRKQERVIEKKIRYCRRQENEDKKSIEYCFSQCGDGLNFQTLACKGICQGIKMFAADACLSGAKKYIEPDNCSR